MYLLALDVRILLGLLFHSENQAGTKFKIMLSYSNGIIFLPCGTFLYKFIIL